MSNQHVVSDYAVSAADFAVLNTVAFAIGSKDSSAVAFLKYGPPRIPVPVLAAVASSGRAQLLLLAAKDRGIPVAVHDDLVARISAAANVGSAIPAELYCDVADVIATLTRSGAEFGVQPQGANG